MDKNTLSNYGWIVIAVLVLAVMIALATPFGKYIESGVRSTTVGLFETSEKAMNVVGMSAGEGNFEDGYNAPNKDKEEPVEPANIIPAGGKYYTNVQFCDMCYNPVNVEEMQLYGCYMCWTYCPKTGCEDCGEPATLTCGCFGNPVTIEYEPTVLVAGQEFPEPQYADVYIYDDCYYVYFDEAHAQVCHICYSSDCDTHITDAGWRFYSGYGQILDSINGINVIAQ